MAPQSMDARLKGQPPVSSHQLFPRGCGVTAAPASELCVLGEAGYLDFKGTSPEFLTFRPVQLKKEAVSSKASTARAGHSPVDTARGCR